VEFVGVRLHGHWLRLADGQLVAVRHRANFGDGSGRDLAQIDLRAGGGATGVSAREQKEVRDEAAHALRRAKRRVDHLVLVGSSVLA
jgi:hypothetical protein